VLHEKVRCKCYQCMVEQGSNDVLMDVKDEIFLQSKTNDDVSMHVFVYQCAKHGQIVQVEIESEFEEI